VPHDVLDADWQPNEADLEVDDRYCRAPAYRPSASQDSIEQAATLLEKARRPVVVAGGGVHASRATTELAALAERLDAVVVTSFSGKGAVNETAPYAAGVLNPLGTSASLELTRRADVVLWCGCKVGQNTSHNWSLPLAHQATIHLDADPSELGRTFRPTVALNGDARATLAGLLAVLRGGSRPEWRQAAHGLIEESARQRSADESSGAVPILPQRVMRELSVRLRPGDVVVSDASFSAGWIAAHVPARRAARDFLFARGQGGLGYAVPAAIGAGAARPSDRIVTVSGDGGFSYALGELATHAQLGLRSVNLVLNNGSLAWLAMWQHLFFEGLRQSVDLENERLRPSYAGVAEALGCVGLRVERPGELGDALDAALAADRPAVIDIRTDPSSTPIHSYRRRFAEMASYPRPGTVYELAPWRRSPTEPTDEPGGR
jgi:acetolactate synthase I/II/III large subunit